ncbi:hypothetical protein NDU88_004658 [Pleurodeles waltl]|uniref:Uncharacterized protein n=1 Tax=Pleurodeles waltl TaxID=8319 RepID=A0AAV7MCB5_PLEWA|nr:hypothetical protein NDU88_004658 [Pleurodeles waltl]
MHGHTAHAQTPLTTPPGDRAAGTSCSLGREREGEQEESREKPGTRSPTDPDWGYMSVKGQLQEAESLSGRKRTGKERYS